MKNAEEALVARKKLQQTRGEIASLTTQFNQALKSLKDLQDMSAQVTFALKMKVPPPPPRATRAEINPQLRLGDHLTMVYREDCNGEPRVGDTIDVFDFLGRETTAIVDMVDLQADYVYLRIDWDTLE